MFYNISETPVSLKLIGVFLLVINAKRCYDTVDMCIINLTVIFMKKLVYWRTFISVVTFLLVGLLPLGIWISFGQDALTTLVAIIVWLPTITFCIWRIFCRKNANHKTMNIIEVGTGIISIILLNFVLFALF